MAIATCQTGGCSSQGRPVEVDLTPLNDPISGEVIPVAAVICGACGEPITDLDERSD